MCGNWSATEGWGERVAELLDALYREEWSWFRNFFCPVMKHLRTEIKGSRKRRTYDKAATPFEWNRHGIEPEVIDYKTMQIVYNGYHLRPEIIESTYYLHHFTLDPQYRKMGETIFNDFVKHCRVDSGYTALKDVVTKEKRDEMESFVLAKTFKYFYLLFAPAETLDFDKVVFNTEAHPLRRTW